MLEKHKDTLFIDMKYIILYRKLGYLEVAPDIFEYHYKDCVITIYSEEQRFEYCGENYGLCAYKDFSVLEAIDRLLKKGYDSSCVLVNSFGYDIAITYPQTRSLYIGIYVSEWGKEYEKLINDYRPNGKTECLYTSQLSGGLVDFKSEIHVANKLFTKGLFEKSASLYPDTFSVDYDERNYGEEFSVKNGELIKYLGSDPVVKVPDGITRIGTGAFWKNLAIKEVILPNSVTCICGDAFVYCKNLQKVNIPAGVNEMGDDPFAGCPNIEIENNSEHFVLKAGVLFDREMKLLIHYTASNPSSEYRIPKSVTWIGKHSFYKCENLRLVVITKNVAFMGNNAFSDCRNIKLKNESEYFHYIDGVLYDKNITTCMHYSMGSGVKIVKLAETVRTIGRNCFWNCDMIEKIIIPASVRQIGYNPFANCKNIVLENHSPYYMEKDGVLYDATGKEVVFCPPTAVKAGNIVLPDGVLNVGRSAFTGCYSLKKILLPMGLRFLGRSAFSGCIGLEEIEIPDSVEEIADWCFDGCRALKSVIIPKHIKILPNTFNDCKAEIIRR